MAKQVQSLIKQRTELPKLPFSVGDRGAFIRKACVAVKYRMVEVAEIVVYSFPYDRVEYMRVPVEDISLDENKPSQYYVSDDHIMGGPAQGAKNSLAWLRHRALESGATPDAIRVLGSFEPFTKKEELSMAEKLKTKASKTADTKGLKAAASKTPVGGKTDKPKKAGNADALARARAAKNVNRKYKPLVRAKDLKLRDDSWTKYMVETILANKDTDSAKAAHASSKQFEGKNLDFTWASAKDYIQFA